MKWSILIATVPPRREQLGALMNVLGFQLTPEVEVIIDWDDFSVDIGAKRQRLLEVARGEYISFIDDDDLVSPDYVRTILPLLDGVDYVGFRVQASWDGRPLKPTYHSLRYEGWWEDSDGYYRDISHLNPVRRELALRGSFHGAYAEDRGWADQIRPHLSTEHFIDEVMYHYFYSPSESLTNPEGRVRRDGAPRLALRWPHVRYLDGVAA